MSFDQAVRRSDMHAGRIALRSPEAEDRHALTHHAGRAAVAQMTASIPNPLPEDPAEDLVRSAGASDRRQDLWIIDGSPEGGPRFLGAVLLKHMGRNQSEVGFWVIPEAWNAGIATEAVGSLVEANPLGNRTYFAAVFQDNPAAARVLVRCGFDYVGEAEAEAPARGTTAPTWTYLRTLG